MRFQEGVGAQPFAGGSRPNYADACVFGSIKAIDRTSAFREIMTETAIKPWYERMVGEVGAGACVLRQ